MPFALCDIYVNLKWDPLNNAFCDMTCWFLYLSPSFHSSYFLFAFLFHDSLKTVRHDLFVVLHSVTWGDIIFMLVFVCWWLQKWKIFKYEMYVRVISMFYYKTWTYWQNNAGIQSSTHATSSTVSCFHWP